MSSVRAVDLALNRWLDEQRQLAQALLESQHRLGEAMRSGDSERIELETRNQAGLLPGLETSRGTLAAILAGGGFSDGAAGVDDLLESAIPAARASLSERWQALREDLRAIQANNRRHALMARSHDKAIVDSLMRLTGRGRSQSSAYGRDGRRDAGPSGRVIARA